MSGLNHFYFYFYLCFFLFKPGATAVTDWLGVDYRILDRLVVHRYR
jgi:hypothetical protein